jgi:serine/threonine protein kinase
MDGIGIRQIGRYKLIDIIGQGGMGIVYRAIDESIDRQVAIKMLLGGHSEDKDLLARFHREARSTANLQHRNIVTVYALDDFEGFPYMVMEYLEGRSIGEMIRSRIPLHIVEKLALMCQVCDGLQYAHDRNVIHRDIKPANVLVLKDNTAKIVDFGIARVGRSETLTRTGQIVGSIYYMSPEQISGSAVDARTDIYSAGVMLFEFLTGSVPFRSPDNDPQGTFFKILNDPVPQLTKFLSDYPQALDDILARAMAKDPAERFQTAEELGYELSCLQETLKQGLIGDFLELARIAIRDNNLEAARQKLQEILRFDRRNSNAAELLQSVREQIQHQQRSLQIEQLKSQAQVAFANQQFEEALECIEQARRLDPEDAILCGLAASIKEQIERARVLADALRRGQAALYSGNLEEANQAVNKALEIQQDHTEARALQTLIKSELEERSHRAKLQTFVDQARRDISNRNFPSALQSLQEAQALDPSDSNIRELLIWAKRGYDQEQERKELNKYIDDVGRLVSENRHPDALNIARAALEKFPNDPYLLKLRDVAIRQIDSDTRRQKVEEIGSEARRLADQGLDTNAIELLEQSLKTFEGDANLEMLLAMIRADYERKILEREEQEKKLRSLMSENPSSDSSVRRTSDLFGPIQELRNGIVRKLPMARLRELADSLREALAESRPTEIGHAQATAALSSFDARLAKWFRDHEVLEETAKKIKSCTNAVELDALTEKARFITEQYGLEDEAQDRFREITTIAAAIRERREATTAQILTILRSMQSSRDVGQVIDLEKQLQVLCSRLKGDPVAEDLFSQAIDFVREMQGKQTRILNELSRIQDAIASASSSGQIRLLREQADLLSSDLTSAEISSRLDQVGREAGNRLNTIENILQALRDTSAKINISRSMRDLEALEAHAKKSASSHTEFEEVAEQLRRIQRASEEKRQEYRKVEAGVKGLLASCGTATGTAELELILARQRDLVERFPNDPVLKKLETHLNESVVTRRAALLEIAASSVETATTDSEDIVGTGLADGVSPSGQDKDEAADHRPGSRRLAIVGLAVCTVLAVGSALFFLLPRTVSIQTSPAQASIRVDTEVCTSPCILKLRPGKHALTATRPGYLNEQTMIVVSLFGAKAEELTLSAAPEPPAPPSTNVTVTSNLTANASILVHTGVPDALVFIDDMKAARDKTGPNGEVRIATTSGQHQILVEKPGYETPSIRTVEVREHGTIRADFPLKTTSIAQSANAKPVPSVPSPQPGVSQPQRQQPNPQQALPVQNSFITIQAPVGAEIHIDQQVIGHSAGGPIKASVPPGSRTVEVLLQGFQPFSQVVNVPAGEQPTLVVKLTPLPPLPTTSPSNPTSGANNMSAGRSTPAVSQQDRMAIQDLLNRYAGAYNQRNLKAVQSLWPSIPSDEVKTIKDFFRSSKSIDMKIQLGNAVPAGKRITIECTQTLRFNMDGKQQEHTESKTIYVIDTSTGWLIDFIPTT